MPTTSIIATSAIATAIITTLSSASPIQPPKDSTAIQATLHTFDLNNPWTIPLPPYGEEPSLWPTDSPTVAPLAADAKKLRDVIRAPKDYGARYIDPDVCTPTAWQWSARVSICVTDLVKLGVMVPVEGVTVDDVKGAMDGLLNGTLRPRATYMGGAKPMMDQMDGAHFIYLLLDRPDTPPLE